MSDQKSVRKNKAVSESSRKHFKYRSNTCLNCGQPLDLSDVYCPYCSQLNSTKPLSLKDFLSEFLNSIVSYDSRLRYTIYDLLFKPGRITKNYTEGQRLKYANPFRFFLSASIIYFIIFGIINTYFTDEGEKFNSNFSQNNIEEATSLSDEEIEEFKVIGIPGVKFKPSQLDSSQVVEARRKDSIEKSNPGYITTKELDTLGWVKRTYEKIDTYFTFHDNTKIKNSSIALDSLKHEKTKFNHWLYNRNTSVERIKNNPYGFLNYMTGKTPFFLFFFAPVLALFFWLIYCRTPYTYMEHLVFIFHIFSFVFIVLFVTSLLEMIIKNSVVGVIFFGLIGPFYFYKALKNFYGQNRFWTIFKFLILNFVFLTGATVFATLFFLVTAAVY